MHCNMQVALQGFAAPDFMLDIIVAAGHSCRNGGGAGFGRAGGA